jgi:hypothetical protein
MPDRNFTGATGLMLPRRALRVLKDEGIFAHSPVSVQHQELAHRYVIRGLESGGAVRELGRYVTFAGDDGGALEYLQPVEAIGFNGIHAVVIAEALVRVDVLRKGQTYELLITRHALAEPKNGNRPQVETAILFRGIHGRIDLDLCGKDKSRAGSIVPTFYSLAGETILLPSSFGGVVRAAVRGVNCLRCVHGHYLRPRSANALASGSERSTVAVVAQALDRTEARNQEPMSEGTEATAS